MDKKKRKTVFGANNSLIDMLMRYEISNLHDLNDDDIEKIVSDLTVLQADESRKSVTEKKEIQIVCENDKYISIFKELFTPELVSQILDTYMYGFNVFEVNWLQKDNLFIPSLEQRDYRDFMYQDGVLKYIRGGYVEIEEYKIITTTYRKRFNKPYGNGLLGAIYLPVKLKNASLDFWVRFLEKFGSPWAIGKTDTDVDNMAIEINNMLSGDTAIIDKDDSIELVYPSNAKGDFDKVVEYCDTQINRAILGANLTGNVSSGSLAAAQVHNDIREDIANIDKKILENVLNKAIKYFKDMNNITDEIYVKFQDEDDPKNALATRDKIIFDMGFKPTLEYIKTTYNIDVTEVTEVATPQVLPNKQPLKTNKIAFKSVLKDSIDNHIETLDTKDIEDNLQDDITQIVSQSSSYEELSQKLMQKYKDMDISKLDELLSTSIHNASLQGSLDCGNDR